MKMPKNPLPSCSEWPSVWIDWMFDKKWLPFLGVFFFVMYPYVLHFVGGPWGHNLSLDEVFHKEVFWYGIAILLLVVPPALVKILFPNNDFPNMRRPYSHLNLFFMVTVAVSISFVIDPFSGDYGYCEHVCLAIVTAGWFCPMFFRIVYIFTTYHKQFKIHFEKSELLLKCGEYVLRLKRANFWLIFGHGVCELFLLIALFRTANDYSASAVMEDIWLLIQGDFSSKTISDCMSFLLYLSLPCLFGCLYYFNIIKKFRVVVTDAIAAYSGGSSEHVNRAFRLYLDTKSDYYIGGGVFWAIAPVLNPIVPILIEVWRQMSSKS